MKRAATVQNVRQSSISKQEEGLVVERRLRFGLRGSVQRSTAFACHIFLMLLAAAFAQSAFAAPRDIDTSFNAEVYGALAPLIYTTAMQPDGKIVIGGSFDGVRAAGINAPRKNIARLNGEGTVDSAFNPNANSLVYCTAVQTNGKIIIGGIFTSVSGVPRNCFARLNADGTLDSGFNPNANSTVWCTAVQADGKIIIGGAFFSVGGVRRNRIARLNADGTLDAGFDPSVSSDVYSIAVQADGKIVIGGAFTTVGGTTRNRLARLNADGTLDTGFDLPVGNNNVSTVYSLTLQADGKIIIGGGFTVLGGVTRNSIARLNADGTLDPDFNPNLNSLVLSTALQADGKILIGGFFTAVGGTTRNYLARLRGDGTLDTGFNPDVGGTATGVYSIAVQANGSILVGSSFTSLGGTGGGRVGRLVNDPATQSLTVPNPSRVECLRGGASPEAQDVAFELSTDRGGTWIPLGTATRIPGGWELSGLSLPANGQVRARARVTGGQSNGSSGLVELVAAFPPNAPPVVANPIADFAVNEDAADTVIDLRAVFQDAETVDAELVFSVQANTNPTLVSATPDNTTGTLALHYQQNQFGTATITVRATDAVGLHAEDTFVVTVNQLHDGDAGDVDPALNPDANGGVLSTALQADNKIVIGGEFTTIGGTPRNHLARLNADGTLDPSFNPNVGDSFEYVYCTAVQPDANILIGGLFTTVNGVARSRIARLNRDGTLDVSFNADASRAVWCMAIQADGKILIGGAFETVNGTGRIGIARLNADGTLDTGFNPNVNSAVYSIALQPDGKIVIGGYSGATGIGGNNLFRVDPDGTLDSAFNPAVTAVFGSVSGAVYSTSLQADGKIVVGGDFNLVSGTARTNVARLNTDGTLDIGFNAKANNIVYTTSVQADGKIVIGGIFTGVGGTVRNRIARFNADGTLDSSFNPNANGGVVGMALQADGKLVIGGGFTAVGGVSRNRIARLENDLTTQSLTVPSANRIEWLRGGGSPEAQYVALELSTDGGATWTTLGVGRRIAGGWELAGLSLPASGQVRARARITGGRSNGSSGLVETTAAFSLASVPYPRLAGIVWLGNGAFQFGFTNFSGVPFTALATTNLTLPSGNWKVLGPATEILPGVFQFTDPAATNFPWRFYQIRSP